MVFIACEDSLKCIELVWILSLQGLFMKAYSKPQTHTHNSMHGKRLPWAKNVIFSSFLVGRLLCEKKGKLYFMLALDSDWSWMNWSSLHFRVGCMRLENFHIQPSQSAVYKCLVLMTCACSGVYDVDILQKVYFPSHSLVLALSLLLFFLPLLNIINIKR